MNGRSRLDALADHHPIETPPMDVKPIGGSEIDLPVDQEGASPGGGSAGPARAREALREERRRLEMGGEEAALRRAAVRSWLGQDVADEVFWCAAREAAHDATPQGRRRELPEHLDPHDLRQAGWGILISEEAQPGLREALQPLLDERRSAAGPLFKEICYRKGDSARRLLEDRLGQAPGVIDPQRAPYYLLLAGGPEEIPFEVQYQLGIAQAVGRIFFEDLEDYRRYATAVVQAECGELDVAGRFTLVSVEHRDDPATQRLKEHLVAPLERQLHGSVDPWQIEVRGADRARKHDFCSLFGGDATPGVLLVACHGLRVPFGAPGQEDLQGALVCQDGSGRAMADPGHCFTAADVAEGARLDGLIAFLLACYGAGTPVGDSFPHEPGSEAVLSPRPFLSSLPQALLARGALAVLGHVDRGWTLSFSWLLQGQIQEAAGHFVEVLRELLTGQRLGHALRPLYRRYAALAAHAAPSVERLLAGEEVDLQELQLLQVAINDMRNFILLGDPAVYASGRRIEL